LLIVNAVFLTDLLQPKRPGWGGAVRAKMHNQRGDRIGRNLPLSETDGD